MKTIVYELWRKWTDIPDVDFKLMGLYTTMELAKWWGAFYANTSLEWNSEFEIYYPDCQSYAKSSNAVWLISASEVETKFPDHLFYAEAETDLINYQYLKAKSTRHVALIECHLDGRPERCNVMTKTQWERQDESYTQYVHVVGDYSSRDEAWTSALKYWDEYTEFRIDKDTNHHRIWKSKE